MNVATLHHATTALATSVLPGRLQTTISACFPRPLSVASPTDVRMPSLIPPLPDPMLSADRQALVAHDRTGVSGPSDRVRKSPGLAPDRCLLFVRWPGAAWPTSVGRMHEREKQDGTCRHVRLGCSAGNLLAACSKDSIL
jgi:hypothetical protein